MIINTQLIEKQQLENVGLDVNSIFLTIQGEGPFVGRPAIFIRLAGCNLTCPMCDTEYTKRVSHTNEQVLFTVNQLHEQTFNPVIVISGGEPFRQNLNPIIGLLLKAGYEVQIETNGTLFQPLAFSHQRLTIVCSPKTGAINSKLYPHIHALKYVVSASDYDEDDGLPNHALGHPCKKLARPKSVDMPVYIQPADEQDIDTNMRNLDVAVKSAKKHGYILGIQLHKYLGVE